MVSRPDRRRVLRVVGLLVLAVVAVPIAIAAVPQLVLADHSYVVTSGSMAPAIGVGDVVLVRSVDPATIQRGDVITFGRSERARTTHRVVEVVEREDGRYFRTKGDANEDRDLRLVAPSSVIGEVVLTVPYAGYFLRFANTRLGVVALMIVPAVLLAVTELWHLRSELRVGDDDAGSAGGD